MRTTESRLYSLQKCNDNFFNIFCSTNCRFPKIHPPPPKEKNLGKKRCPNFSRWRQPELLAQTMRGAEGCVRVVVQRSEGRTGKMAARQGSQGIADPRVAGAESFICL